MFDRNKEEGAHEDEAPKIQNPDSIKSNVAFWMFYSSTRKSDGRELKRKKEHFKVSPVFDPQL